MRCGRLFSSSVLIAAESRVVPSGGFAGELGSVRRSGGAEVRRRDWATRRAPGHIGGRCRGGAGAIHGGVCGPGTAGASAAAGGIPGSEPGAGAFPAADPEPGAFPAADPEPGAFRQRCRRGRGHLRRGCRRAGPAADRTRPAGRPRARAPYRAAAPAVSARKAAPAGSSTATASSAASTAASPASEPSPTEPTARPCK